MSTIQWTFPISGHFTMKLIRVNTNVSSACINPGKVLFTPLEHRDSLIGVDKKGIKHYNMDNWSLPDKIPTERI